MLKQCTHVFQKERINNLVTARKRSCPAVSQIWSLIFLPDTSMILVPNSTPIVCGQSAVTENQKQRLTFQPWWWVWNTLHFCSVNWCSKQDLPTPMSPTMMYLNMYEYCEEDIFRQHLLSTARVKVKTIMRNARKPLDARTVRRRLDVKHVPADRLRRTTDASVTQRRDVGDTHTGLMAKEKTTTRGRTRHADGSMAHRHRTRQVRAGVQRLTRNRSDDRASVLRAFYFH